MVKAWATESDRTRSITRRRSPARLGSLLAITATLTVSAGLGGASAQSEAPADDRTGVVLRYTTWSGGGLRNELYDEIAAQFVADDPRVDAIEHEFQPFPRYHDVLNVGLATGNAPDFAWMNGSFVPIYIQSGALRDIRADLEAQPGYELGDFTDEVLAPWIDGDALYAIPHSTAPNSVYVNKDIWTAAGLPDPQETLAAGGWTWDHIRQAAKQIVESGAAPIGFAYKDAVFSEGWRLLEDLFSPFGARPWDDAGVTCQFTDPEMIEAATFFHELMYLDKTHPTAGEQYDFLAGNVGALLERPTDAADFADAPFAFDVLPSPAGPAESVPALGAGAWGVLNSSPNADIAAEFVAVLSSPENMAKLSPVAIPPRENLQTLDVLVPNNPVLTEAQIQTAILDPIQAPNATRGYRHWNWGPIDSASNAVWDSQVYTADADIPAAMAAMCDSIAPFLVPPPGA